jgi:acetolactate synthase I/II/III large subunit
VDRTGAQMIVESLRREGVDTVFGYPGGSVIPLFDALYDAKDIRLILTRHEQAAVHAADGYARATGRVGVCIATSGPGATNTVTGLATARFDSIPLVCITGQVPRSMIGNDAFQEADTVGITQPVTKHNYLVMERKDVGRILKQSFYLAASGRPGPVVVDVPKDVFIERLDDEYPETASIRGYKPADKAEPGQVALLADALAKASRPLFFLGGGMVLSGARDVFASILETTGIPLITSLMGIGVVDSGHPLNLGMLGMHGSIAANKALTACDLLVGLGVRYDDRATGDTARFAPKARIVHVDIDPSSIGRNLRVDLPIVGDLKSVLTELSSSVEKRDIGTWLAEIEGFRAEGRRFEDRAGGTSGDDASLPSARAILTTLSEVFPDAVFTTEVGQHQMWAAQYLPFSQTRRWLTSGGLGTMGYGFPAALGAQAGLPEDHVVVVAGDGSFQMNIQELATCVQEDLPVIVVVMDNGYLGMVRQWQEMFQQKRYSSTCLQYRRGCPPGCSSPGVQCPPYSPDFASIARAYGADGYEVDTLEEFREAATLARASRRPAVIDCHMAREENVWPMVAPGKGNDQMLYEGEPV